MATHALPSSHILDDDDDAPAAPASARKSALLRRLYDALLQSQMRRAHREIDRVLGPAAFARALRPKFPPDA